MGKSLIKMSVSIVSLLLLTASVAAADVNTKEGIVTGTVELTKGAKNQNSIVYLEGIPGQFSPVQEGVVLDQKSKTFLHPFFTTVNHETGGEFRIENVPPGDYTLVVARDIRGELKKTEEQIAI